MCICGSLSPEFLRPGCNPTKHPASRLFSEALRVFDDQHNDRGDPVPCSRKIVLRKQSLKEGRAIWLARGASAASRLGAAARLKDKVHTSRNRGCDLTRVGAFLPVGRDRGNYIVVFIARLNRLVRIASPGHRRADQLRIGASCAAGPIDIVTGDARGYAACPA